MDVTSAGRQSAGNDTAASSTAPAGQTARPTDAARPATTPASPSKAFAAVLGARLGRAATLGGGLGKAGAGGLKGGGSKSSALFGEALHGGDHAEVVRPKRGREDDAEGDRKDGDGDGDGDLDLDLAGREEGGVHWRAERSAELEAIDPANRVAASLAPPPTSLVSPVNEAAEAPLRARTLEELLPALVRKIAWAGDRHKATVRLELGAGVHAGTTVTVHADGGRVRVELTGTEGRELDGLRQRLDARLRGHGLDVESVT